MKLICVVHDTSYTTYISKEAPLHSVGSIRFLTERLWLVLLAVWLISAFTVKRTVVRQSSRSRIWYLFNLALGSYLIFAERVDVPWINTVLVQMNLPVAACGFAIVCLGIAFAIWARLTLGGNWSGAVTIKENHTLVQRGPYRIVRHPIYTGILLALAGSALQYGYLRSLVGVLLCGFGFWLKSLFEEQFMAQRFGNEYLEYRRRVPALIPFIFQGHRQ